MKNFKINFQSENGKTWSTTHKAKTKASVRKYFADECRCLRAVIDIFEINKVGAIIG